MNDHDQWHVQRTLNIQGIKLEELRSEDQWALRRDGEITEQASEIEIRYVFDLIERTLAPKREAVIPRDSGGWVSGSCV